MAKHVVERIKGGLVVSCQSEDGNPFHGPESMARFARSAELGGAVGIRAKEPDIRAIKQLCSLPILGIDKVYFDGLPGQGFEVYITPRFADAQRIAAAGADLVALDATPRPRPGGDNVSDIIRRIKAELKLPVMADISTLDEALTAEGMGADLVATTLSGYTSYAPRGEGPDWDLLRAIIGAVRIPVVAEGGITTPAEARRAMDMGAWAVVIGSAITRPIEITRRFVKGMAG